MSDLLRKMEKRRQALAVAQHRYNQLRGRIPDAEIAIVEGSDDAVFYSSIFKREGNQSTEYFFVANGKDNVLGLRELILKSKDIPRGGGVVFFVDRDFDGLKGQAAGREIYMTPTYSIENILVCKGAFRNILLAEFKLGDADSIQDIDRILLQFDKIMEQHAAALAEANELIHCVRQEALKSNLLTTGSISDQPKKFADIDAETLTVTKNASGKAIEELITIQTPIPEVLLNQYKEDFSALAPNTSWRGKFLYFLFRRFVFFLVEDKNKNTPKYFSKGGGRISLDTATDSFIRVLAAGCVIPECLKQFVVGIPTHKLL
jgi:hypothetical protein